MKVIKWVAIVAAVFIPFIMAGYAVMTPANGLDFILGQNTMDWLWFIMLGAMMLGLYNFVPVFVQGEEEIAED
jgi:hypothetical protein